MASLLDNPLTAPEIEGGLDSLSSDLAYLLADSNLPDDVRVTAAGVAGDTLRAGEICGTLSLRAPTRQACIVRARAILDRWPMAGLVLDDGPLRRLLEDQAFWKAPLDREMAAQRTGLGARALPGRPMLPD